MSPQGTGPVHRHPRGCWAGSSDSSYIFREAGGTVGPPCAGVQELLFQSALFKDLPVGVSSSPSAGSSSALPTPLKAAGGIPSPSPAAERGWGGPALPSPGLWNRVKETQMPRARAGRGSPGSSTHLWVLPGPEGPSQPGGAQVWGLSGSGTLGS